MIELLKACRNIHTIFIISCGVVLACALSAQDLSRYEESVLSMDILQDIQKNEIMDCIVSIVYPKHRIFLTEDGEIRNIFLYKNEVDSQIENIRRQISNVFSGKYRNIQIKVESNCASPTFYINQDFELFSENYLSLLTILLSAPRGYILMPGTLSQQEMDKFVDWIENIENLEDMKLCNVGIEVPERYVTGQVVENVSVRSVGRYPMTIRISKDTGLERDEKQSDQPSITLYPSLLESNFEISPGMWRTALNDFFRKQYGLDFDIAEYQWMESYLGAMKDQNIREIVPIQEFLTKMYQEEMQQEKMEVMGITVVRIYINYALVVVLSVLLLYLGALLIHIRSHYEKQYILNEPSPWTVISRLYMVRSASIMSFVIATVFVSLWVPYKIGQDAWVAVIKYIPIVISVGVAVTAWIVAQSMKYCGNQK